MALALQRHYTSKPSENGHTGSLSGPCPYLFGSEALAHPGWFTEQGSGGGVRTWVQPRFELPALRGGGGGGGGGGGNNNIENLGLTWVQPGFNHGAIFFSALSEQKRSTVLVFGL